MPTKKTKTNNAIQPGKLMETMETVHEKFAKCIHPLKHRESAFKDDYFLLHSYGRADNEIDLAKSSS